MKKEITKFLLVISFLLFFSCGNKVNHDKALTFISTIWQNYSIATDSIETYTNKLKEAIEITKSNNDRKLDETSTDSLKKYYQSSIKTLALSIKKINELDEFDLNINMKSKMLNLFKDMKYLLDSCSTQIINSLNHGLDNISNQEIEKIKEFTSLNQNISIEQNDINKLGPIFQEKYHIKDDELK